MRMRTGQGRPGGRLGVVGWRWAAVGRCWFVGWSSWGSGQGPGESEGEGERERESE